MRQKTPRGHGSCVSGFQTGSQRQLVRCCLTALLWLAAIMTAQGFGHHVKLAGEACPILLQSSAVFPHLKATSLTPSLLLDTSTCLPSCSVLRTECCSCVASTAP